MDIQNGLNNNRWFTSGNIDVLPVCVLPVTKIILKPKGMLRESEILADMIKPPEMPDLGYLKSDVSFSLWETMTLVLA